MSASTGPTSMVLSADGTSAYVGTPAKDQAVLEYTVAADGTLSLKTPSSIAAGQGPHEVALVAAPRKKTSTQLSVTPPSPAAAGTAEKLTATVNPSAAGSVQFKDGPAPVGTPVTVADGTASMTATLPVGIHSLSAVFTPTDTVAFTGSTSTLVSYVVYATATDTTLTVAPNPFKATRWSSPPTCPPTARPRARPGLSVHRRHRSAKRPATGYPGGIAQLKTSALSTGSHTLTAVFIPPPNTVDFGPSTSPPVPLTVRPPLR